MYDLIMVDTSYYIFVKNRIMCNAKSKPRCNQRTLGDRFNTCKKYTTLVQDFGRGGNFLYVRGREYVGNFSIFCLILL